MYKANELVVVAVVGVSMDWVPFYWTVFVRTGRRLAYGGVRQSKLSCPKVKKLLNSSRFFSKVTKVKAMLKSLWSRYIT